MAIDQYNTGDECEIHIRQRGTSGRATVRILITYWCYIHDAKSIIHFSPSRHSEGQMKRATGKEDPCGDKHADVVPNPCTDDPELLKRGQDD
jgi:hypothetical protein